MTYETNGNLYYWMLGVKDVERGKRFFAPLFNWEFDDEGGDPGNIRRAGGLHEGSEGFTFYFWVDDVAAAAGRVTGLGGTIGAKQTGRSGDWADCVDPNGVHVSIGRLSPEFEATLKPPRTGGAELDYFAIPAPDVEKGKAFYAELLWWEFQPMSEQYAHCTSVQPAGGLARMDGSQPVGWFHVDDIHATVALVRELGGTADEPSPWGPDLSAGCQDDQGTAFNIWQSGTGS